MRRGMKVIGLGVLIFCVGIIIIAVSTWSTLGSLQYKQILVTYPLSPGTGKDIPLSAMIGPFEGIKAGINISGSFEGHLDQALFWVRDLDGRLIYSSPAFPAPSNIIEFYVNPGFYTITFNLLFNEDSRVEVYEYREDIRMIYPHRTLYYPGVFLSVAGLIASAVGAFMPSKKT
jgi:hypothetical protein